MGIVKSHVSANKLHSVYMVEYFVFVGTRITQPEALTDSFSVAVPRRVSWVTRSSPASGSQMDRRKKIPFKHLTRQRSFSLESQANVPKCTNLEISRKCVSLKSSPLISAHVSTLPASFSVKSSINSSPASVQKQPTPERSIMAELRRSSEIFKSILLNLSIKENDSVLEVVHSSTSSIVDIDVDVDNLMAAHKQLCLENCRYFYDSSSSSSSSTYSSRSSSPDRSSFSGSDIEEIEKGVKSIRDVEATSYLKPSSNIPPIKLGEMMETYGRQFLYSLPPIFIAVVKGNPITTGLLMKYGADVNYQVGT